MTSTTHVTDVCVGCHSHSGPAEPRDWKITFHFSRDFLGIAAIWLITTPGQSDRWKGPAIWPALVWASMKAKTTAALASTKGAFPREEWHLGLDVRLMWNPWWITFKRYSTHRLSVCDMSAASHVFATNGIDTAVSCRVAPCIPAVVSEANRTAGRAGEQP